MSKLRPDRKAARVEAAKVSMETWKAFGPSGQLDALDKRLGKGKGAVKQRARLAKKLGTKTE